MSTLPSPAALSPHRNRHATAVGSRTAGSSLVRRVRRVLGITLASLVVLFFGILVWGLDHRLQHETVVSRLPLPGRFVDVGGRNLHVVEAGREHRGRGPTVVLETGWSGMSVAWQHVLEQVGEHNYVIAYDRAGHGLSDDHARPHDARAVARDLGALLRADRIPGPFVLVGHSLGGIYVRVFAAGRDDVAGVVLVDSTHPDQRARSASIRAQMDESTGLLDALPMLAELGIVRGSGALASHADGLRGEAHAWAVEMLADPEHLRAARAEMHAWDASMQAARESGSLGDVSLRVLTAGDTSRGGGPDFATLQSELVTLSSDGTREIVEGADHFTLVLDPRHARRISNAVRELAVGAGEAD